MAGVQRLQHIQRLAAAHLAHDQAIGAHPDGVPHQVAQRHRRIAESDALQPADVVLLQLQLGRLLDGDDALVPGDAGRQGVEQGRLAAARAAGDQQVRANLDAGPQERGRLDGQAAEPDQVVEPEGARRELADGEHRSVDRDRREHDGEPGAVWQANFQDRIAGVEPAAGGRDQRFDGGHEVVFVSELPVRHKDPTVALDVDRVGPVDHDLGQAGVAEQRQDRLEVLAPCGEGRGGGLMDLPPPCGEGGGGGLDHAPSVAVGATPDIGQTAYSCPA